MFFLFSGKAYSGDITFEASLDRYQVSLGNSIQLNLTFHNTQRVPAPELPEMKDFESRYIGPSSRMSIINGRVISSIAYNYRLIPLKKGSFTLGPFTAEYSGQTYESNTVTVEVVEGSVQEKRAPVVSADIQKALKQSCFLVMKIGKKTVYLNEEIPVTMKLYVSRLGVRDIQYPQFPHEGFSVGKLGKPSQYKQSVDGVLYEVLEFKTTMFGTKPGQFAIGPASVKCNVVVRKQSRRMSRSPFDDFFGEDVFDNFFGRYETYPLDLKAEEIPVEVLSLPEKGKPSGFSGAVGSFDFEINVDPKDVKVGDPITVKMVISGKGNFSTVTVPEIVSQQGFKLYEPQIKIEENCKIFEQILMPKTDKITKVPGIVFNFFDPETGKYKKIEKGPVSIKVLPSEEGGDISIVEYSDTPAKALKKETLGRGIIYIKESPGKLKRKGTYLYKNKVFLFFQLLPVILLIVFLSMYKKSERIRTDVQYARRLHAPKKARAGIRKTGQLISEGSAQEFYNTVFKTLQEYLGGKFHIPAGGITGAVVDEVLGKKDISKDILDKLKSLFRECDMARYAPLEFGKDSMEQSFGNLQSVIDYLERHKI